MFHVSGRLLIRFTETFLSDSYNTRDSSFTQTSVSTPISRNEAALFPCFDSPLNALRCSPASLWSINKAISHICNTWFAQMLMGFGGYERRGVMSASKLPSLFADRPAELDRCCMRQRSECKATYSVCSHWLWLFFIFTDGRDAKGVWSPAGWWMEGRGRCISWTRGGERSNTTVCSDDKTADETTANTLKWLVPVGGRAEARLWLSAPLMLRPSTTKQKCSWCTSACHASSPGERELVLGNKETHQ